MQKDLTVLEVIKYLSDGGKKDSYHWGEEGTSDEAALFAERQMEKERKEKWRTEGNTSWMPMCETLPGTSYLLPNLFLTITQKLLI